MRTALLALLLCSGCSKDATETAAAETDSPHPTDSGDTRPPTDTQPEVDLTHGAFELRYGFEGFAGGASTCAEVGTDTLWLDMNNGASAEPTRDYPCDDQPLQVAADEAGTWVISLRTVATTFDAKGSYGESYAVYLEAEPGEFTEGYVGIVCEDNGGEGCQ